MSSIRVFISYSHDSVAHKEWVHELCCDLVENGVDVILDQWNLRLGQDIVHFMNEGIACADRVILICSLDYVLKADAGLGGVGYERQIVSAEIARNINTDKFIPIVRNNSGIQKLPAFMGQRLYLDFESEEGYKINLERFLIELHGLPQKNRPRMGGSRNSKPLRSHLEDSSGGIERLPLAPRELEALYLAFKGLKPEEIATRMDVSQRTVNFHTFNGLNKLRGFSPLEIMQTIIRDI